MSVDLSSNILGLNVKKTEELLNTNNKKVNNAATGFDSLLNQTMSTSSGSSSLLSILNSTANSNSSLLSQISNSNSVSERESLGKQFAEKVVENFKAAGHAAETTGDADKIVVDGKKYDILRSLSSPGAEVKAQFMFVENVGSSSGGGGTTTPVTGTVSEVVKKTADANQDVIDNINNAKTLDERLKYVDQMRDILVKALNDAGHDAWTYGSHDKFVVNGDLIDFCYASTGVGWETKIQVLNHGPAEDHGITRPGDTGGTTGNDLNSSVLAVGKGLGSILNQISSSYDVDERQQLAGDFISQLIDGLKDYGFEASAHSDPDKININGSTYDVIRSLNSPGKTASLQFLQVA